MKILLELGVVATLLVGQIFCISKLQEQFRWNQLDYEYPSEQARINALRSAKFIPENNLPVGIEVWNGKLFVSVPRWRPGIPATLNYIPLHPATPSTPRLIPYPDWPSNELGNCERGLTTVYRIKVDKCDRLWVLDTGTFGIGNTTTNPCPYALNVFDLRTDKKIRRYELRKEDINANTFIANIAVDIGSDCNDAFAYMSDELGYGLIAYSWAENRSWRFTHGFFLPDPLKGEFSIGGLNFQWFEEGIFGISLSPLQTDGFRTLFFSPLASHREFAVSTRVLRNSSKVDDSYTDFVPLEERGPLSHTTSRVMDDYGVQLYNLVDQNAIGCWNMKNPYNPAYHAIVDKDDEALIFPADVKVDRERNAWIISDRMPNFLLSTLNPKDINFRIFFAPVDVLIKGTPCDDDRSQYVYAYPQEHVHVVQQPQHSNIPKEALQAIEEVQQLYNIGLNHRKVAPKIPKTIEVNPQSYSRQIFGFKSPQTFPQHVDDKYRTVHARYY